MMKSIRAEERIRIHGKLLEAIPQEFTWRGRRYSVQRIERMTPMANERTAPGSRKEFFVLQTKQGLRCRISHDRGRDIWRLEQLLGAGGGVR
jgi:hypothetical protein